MRPLLILRPEPAASATAAAARRRGLAPIVAPLFAIEPVAWTLPAGPFHGLLLTSANAVRMGGPALTSLQRLPVHAVGSATASAASAAGLEVASSGSGNVDDLLRQLPSGLRLLHLAGEDRREPASARQTIVPVTVYRAAPLPSPPALATAGEAVALVHSPRAGRRLAELVRDRGQLAVAAISPAAAEACGGGWQSIRHADHPADEVLLSLAADLCKDGGTS